MHSSSPAVRSQFKALAFPCCSETCEVCRSFCATASNEAEEALWHAIHPLLSNPDEHVMASISSLLLALVEGRPDLPLSGVFGGKTRSAAALVAGLLVLFFFLPPLSSLFGTQSHHLGASEMSDQQSMLEHAYKAARDAFKVRKDGTLDEATLNVMEIFPPSGLWPK